MTTVCGRVNSTCILGVLVECIPTGVGMYGLAQNQRQSLATTEKDVDVKIALAMLMIVILAFAAGLAAVLVAVLLGESTTTAVEWGGKSAVCVATLGLAAAGLILLHT